MPRDLLNTNICFHIKNHRPAEVLTRFIKLVPGDVAISVITYGELSFGAEKSAKPGQTHRTLTQLIGAIPVLPLDVNAATQYGIVRQHLQASGKVKGNDDLWIAAYALADKHVLMTNNVDEFARVPKLRIEN